MSRLVAFPAVPTTAPRVTEAAADRLIAGSPVFKTWDIDNVDDGRIRAGFWEATPGTTRSIKGTSWEYCSILSGVVVITEEGGEPHRFTAGDTFVMRPGFVGTWETIETVRKLWVIVAGA